LLHNFAGKQFIMEDIHQPGTRKVPIIVLSMAHMINDMYMNQISVLLPFFVIAGLSVSKGAFLVSGFTITSSLLQPVFGALSDKNSRQWLVFTGTLWMAFMLSLIGLTTNYSLLMIIVALGGLGTAAFHPQASAMVATNSRTHKTFIQAIFIASGNIGWALTPLLAVPLVQQFGLTVTPVFMIPGILVSILLWLLTRGITLPVKSKTSESILSVLKQNRAELTKIMLIVAFRSLTYFSLIAFLPIYLQQKGISIVRGGQMVFLMLFTGSLGGLLGGFLADKIGRKIVIVFSLSLATPFFYLFLISVGWLSIIFLALAGAFLLATFSVTVAAAHNVIRNNAGLASGLTLGFGTGIGGLGVGIMGLITHYLNVSTAIYILIMLPLVASLLGLSLKEKNVVSKTI
jgi:MFS transporter, FSR family, fosmidomycin resistance protein